MDSLSSSEGDLKQKEDVLPAGHYLVCGPGKVHHDHQQQQQHNRTLPNHYISDSSMIVDLRGRTAVVTGGPVPTLLIGGVPLRMVPAAAVQYGQPQAPVYSQSTVSTAAPSPVYETIDSDLSDCSGVHSEQGEVGSAHYQDMSCPPRLALGAPFAAGRRRSAAAQLHAASAALLHAASASAALCSSPG